MPPNGPQSEMAFEIKFAVLQFRNLLFMLICLHLQGQRTWQHWTWDPGRKGNTKIQEMKPGLNHIRCIKAGLFLKQGGEQMSERVSNCKHDRCLEKGAGVFPRAQKDGSLGCGAISKVKCWGKAKSLPAYTSLLLWGGGRREETIKYLKKFYPSGS